MLASFSCPYQDSGIEVIHITGTPTEIPFGFAADCGILWEVRIPDTVEIINSMAFNGCYTLHNVFLHEGLRRIEKRALHGCRNMRQIRFPSTLEYLGEASCGNWTTASALFCRATTPPACEGDDVFDGTPTDIPLYVPTGSVPAYREAVGWRLFQNILESDDPWYASDDTPSVESAVTVEAAAGGIVIDGRDTGYGVWTIDGQLVASGRADGSVKVAAPAGICLVRAGGDTHKVAVR